MCYEESSASPIKVINSNGTVFVGAYEKDSSSLKDIITSGRSWALF